MDRCFLQGHGRVDNTKIDHQYATDSLNNTFQVLNSEFLLLLDQLPKRRSPNSLFYYFAHSWEEKKEDSSIHFPSYI